MSEFIGETPRPHRADVEKRARRDRVFLNNPVIMQGLGARAAHRGGYHAEKRCDAFGGGYCCCFTPTRVLAARSAALRISGSAGSPMLLTAAAVFVGVRYVMGLLYPVSDLGAAGPVPAFAGGGPHRTQTV